MLLFAPKAPAGESRTAIDPAAAQKLVSLGLRVVVESGLGLLADADDSAYAAAGAEVVGTSQRESVLSEADIVTRIRVSHPQEIGALKEGALHISFFDPFVHPELLEAFAKGGVSAVSLEFIPRTTLAQKMDALSSQANLAGYAAVVLAAERLRKVLPMLMTPAGTLQPSRYFIVGAGVAGLQAIATAKRLGARVEAYDTRPVVEEQVRSLGARFVKIDVGETGQTQQGYARELTAEQIQKQRDGMAKVCAQSDVVITTARVFGRKAPVLITKEMVAGMKRGSIIVDLAADAGGNVEGTRPDEEVFTGNGVRIVGLTRLEGHVSQHASQMFASNISAFIEHFWNAREKTFEWRMDDDILKGSLLTHKGEIVHERFRPEAPQVTAKS